MRLRDRARVGIHVTIGFAILIAFVVVAIGFYLVGPSGKDEKLRQCGGLYCTTVDVPLDRAGRDAGVVHLHVEATSQFLDDAAFLIAGGPGQSATTAFHIGHPTAGWAAAFPDRPLVAVDLRGTGKSGALRCRRSATCGRELGRRAGHFTIQDDVDDLEAVRQALGTKTIAIGGSSWGGRLAVAYARVHPARVSELVLSSPASVDGGVFVLDSLRAIPRVLEQMCTGRRCRAASATPAADAVELAARLEKQPAKGAFYWTDGKRYMRRWRAVDYLYFLLTAHVDPALSVALPAAIADALQSHPEQLLRYGALQRLVESSNLYSGLSEARFAATDCTDATLVPWRRETSPVARRQALRRAESRLGDATAPFPNSAASASIVAPMNVCLGWPAAPRPVPAGTLPNIAVLLLVGDLDLITPVETVRRIASLFPKARIVVAPGLGHSVLGRKAGGIACAGAVEAWAAGRTPPSQCAAQESAARALPAGSWSLSELPPLPPGGETGRLLTATWRTVFDARTALGFLADPDRVDGKTVAPGLRGGTATYAAGNLVLHGYSLVPGVRISGTLQWTDLFGTVPPLSGQIRVVGHGLRAAFRVNDAQTALVGTIADKRVRIPISL